MEESTTTKPTQWSLQNDVQPSELWPRGWGLLVVSGDAGESLKSSREPARNGSKLDTHNERRDNTTKRSIPTASVLRYVNDGRRLGSSGGNEGGAATKGGDAITLSPGGLPPFPAGEVSGGTCSHGARAPGVGGKLLALSGL